jgi:EpsI family protein
MTIQRLAFLQLLLLAGLGSVYLVPAQTKTQPVGVTMDLPDFIGQWYGVPQQITQRERDELAADTTFARRLYSNGMGDQILVSIVLAGEDPDNSLHRPERCLPSQGWTMMDSKVVMMTAPALPGEHLTTTRLHSQQKFPDQNGNVHTIYNLNYYWFVGYTDLTSSAIQRALWDIRDRVVKGYDQRWAYVTVASNITEGLTKFGRSEKQTDEIIQAFIVQLFPQIIKPTVSEKLKS